MILFKISQPNLYERAKPSHRVKNLGYFLAIKVMNLDFLDFEAVNKYFDITF